MSAADNYGYRPWWLAPEWDELSPFDQTRSYLSMMQSPDGLCVVCVIKPSIYIGHGPNGIVLAPAQESS